MSKYNITFKGKKYEIDKSLLADTIANLEAAFSELSGGNEITWDGNTEGLEMLNFAAIGSDFNLYKVSDKFFTKQEVLGGVGTATRADGSSTDITITGTVPGTNYGCTDPESFGLANTFGTMFAIFVHSNETISFYGATLTLTRGVYFTKFVSGANAGAYASAVRLPNSN